MNFLRKIFKGINVPSAIDPLMGKTVIHFTTHGCMATIHEFDYIGTIVNSSIKEGRYKMYQVKVLKDKNGELRDNNVKDELRAIPSWYLQDLGGDFLIAYD
jgi:hypothetical protein